MRSRQFYSDNESGIHPRVLAAIADANEGHASSYGHDDVTEALRHRAEEVLGTGTRIYPVFIGTAANVLSAAGVVAPYEAVVCAGWDDSGADSLSCTSAGAADWLWSWPW